MGMGAQVIRARGPHQLSRCAAKTPLPPSRRPEKWRRGRPRAGARETLSEHGGASAAATLRHTQVSAAIPPLSAAARDAVLVTTPDPPERVPRPLRRHLPWPDLRRGRLLAAQQRRGLAAAAAYKTASIDCLSEAACVGLLRVTLSTAATSPATGIPPSAFGAIFNGISTGAAVHNPILNFAGPRFAGR